MSSDSTQQDQSCLRCHSARLVHGHGFSGDSIDFTLNPEDRDKSFRAFWRLEGLLNFHRERTLCLDCGLVTGSVDPAKAEKMLLRGASDELLARLGLARNQVEETSADGSERGGG